MHKETMQLHSDPPYSGLYGRYIDANMREMEQCDLTRELHDTVIQPLTSLLISFTQIEHQLSSTGLIEAHLPMWKGLAQEALDSLRSSLANLRTPSYRTDDLPRSLRSMLIPQFSEQGLQLYLESCDWPAALPPHWNSHLYLAVREAVTNVQKHAHASEVHIQLHTDPDSLTITIQDNGVGFPDARGASEKRSRPGCGLGITSIRERVKLLGGHMTLSSAPGHGVHVKLHLPRPMPMEQLTSYTPERGDAEYTVDGYIH